jgi:hypothetical protein
MIPRAMVESVPRALRIRGVSRRRAGDERGG